MNWRSFFLFTFFCVAISPIPGLTSVQKQTVDAYLTNPLYFAANATILQYVEDPKKPYFDVQVTSVIHSLEDRPLRHRRPLSSAQMRDYLNTHKDDIMLLTSLDSQKQARFKGTIEVLEGEGKIRLWIASSVDRKRLDDFLKTEKEIRFLPLAF